ncbi:uncharacterized protein METZ01_LOCUS369977, partial [marine metagenome]
PEISSTAVLTVDEDALYSYTTTATDDDGDTVTLACTTVPAWLTCTAGALSGTPDNDDVGSHSVVITATDGNSGSATDSFSIAVVNTNDAPEISSTAVLSVDEDALYSYTTTATDVDGDTVTLACTTVPSWLTCTAGALSGTPADADVGSHSVVITATDGNSGSATDSFSIAVANTNDAPSISSTAVTAVNEDASYSYSITTSDADSDSSDSWTITSSSVSWLTLIHTAGASTAALAGIPDDGDVGVHSVTITVADAAGATGTQTFDITVANTNDAPSITSTGGTAVDEDALYSYSITTSDDDSDS